MDQRCSMKSRESLSRACVNQSHFEWICQLAGQETAHVVCSVTLKMNSVGLHFKCNLAFVITGNESFTGEGILGHYCLDGCFNSDTV